MPIDVDELDLFHHHPSRYVDITRTMRESTKLQSTLAYSIRAAFVRKVVSRSSIAKLRDQYTEAYLFLLHFIFIDEILA
jgi:hypothetical protein